MPNCKLLLLFLLNNKWPRKIYLTALCLTTLGTRVGVWRLWSWDLKNNNLVVSLIEWSSGDSPMWQYLLQNRLIQVSIFSLTHLGSKRTMLGKAYGTKWSAIGNFWGTHWEFEEHVENAVGTGWGTHWEKPKSNTPIPTPKETKLDLLGACCNS